MNISFSSKNLQKNCNSEKESNKRWGPQRAGKIRRRLAELLAADTLADMGFLPPARLHELSGKRKGQFAVDITGNYRLIFKPDHDPVPKRKDRGIDLKKVADIMILEVEDYHGS